MLSRKPIVRRNRERKAPPIEKSTYLGEPKFCNRGRKSYVEDWVIERIIAVNDNPQLKVIDRKTVNGVFYIVRPRMLDAGFEVKLQHRVKVTSTYIREVCEQHGYYRSELGIVTAARAQIYYHGVTYDVNEDNIKMLSKLGTDLVVIEKEGVVKALAPFADKYRIALMYTRGFPIEYVQMIVDVINENNRHVLLVTDFDTAGIQIGLNLNDIVRIGVNFKTIEYFFSDKLRQHPGNETLGKFISDAKIVKELEEVYEHAEEDSHLTSLKDQLPGGKNNPIVKYFQPNGGKSIERRRIEIDKILLTVGNETFWKWIIHHLREQHPYRDYVDVVEVPDDSYFMPSELNGIASMLSKKFQRVLRPVINRYITEMEDYKGFISDVDKYESDMRDDLQEYLDENTNLVDMREDLQKILDKYKDADIEG